MAIDVKKRNKQQYEWQKAHTDRINFTMPKGMKDQIILAAEAEGVKPAEYIRSAIMEKMMRGGVDVSMFEKIEDLERVPVDEGC